MAPLPIRPPLAIQALREWQSAVQHHRLRRLRLFPGPEHVHEPQLRDAAAGSYVSTLPVGDRPATFRRYEAPQRHD